MAQTAIAKPKLRKLGTRAWGYGLAFALGVSASFAVWFKYAVVEKRKQHYKDFYDNWDDQKEFAAMKEARVFKGFEPS